MTLANDDRMVALVVNMLEIAQAGGMSEERMEEIYDELMSCYSELESEAADDLFNVVLLKIHSIESAKH